MSYSSSFAHLDGVEFKISDTYKLPKVEELPRDFKMKDLTGILLESEYDFSKEHRALAKIHAARENERKKEEEEEKRKILSLKRKDEEKLKKELLKKQQRELFEKQRGIFLEQRRKQQEHERTSPESCASSDGSSSSRASPSSDGSSEVPPPVPPKNPMFNQGGNLTLLTPISVDSQEPSQVQTQSSSSLPTASNQSQSVPTGSNQIWVDFEDKGLDPFSNMELQTIDDMKELQIVLQRRSVDLAKNNLELPSYKQVSSNKKIYENVKINSSLYENVTMSNVKEIIAEQSQAVDDLKSATSETKTSEVSSTNPFYSEMTNRDVHSRNGEKDLTVTDINRNYENVKLDKDSGFMSSSDVPGGSALDNATKTFTVTCATVATNEQTADKPVPRTREYINVKKVVQAPSVTEKQSIESIYSFANEVGVKEVATREVKEDAEQSIYSTIGQDPALDVYTQIKPKRLAPKPPTNHDKTSLNQNKPAPPKVLPVSFGSSSSSISPLTVLPPITTASVIASNLYMNTTESTMTRSPRRPPAPHVPPRDPQVSWNPGQTWVNFSNTSPISSPHEPIQSLPSTSPILSHSSPSLTPKSSPNGPAPRSISASDYSKPAVPPRIRKPPTVNSNSELFMKQSHEEKAKFGSNEQVNRSNEHTAKVQSSPKTGRTFLKQSKDERAKFEETMNRALTSLPKNPAISHKPTTPPLGTSPFNTQAPGTYSALGTRNISDHTVHTTPARMAQTTPAVSLSPSERKFVGSITSMGFSFDATVRAMKIHGKDGKEVVDHLCLVQKISDRGFSTSQVQDAFELFKNDETKIMQFLLQFSRLTDMGFAEDDVKKALYDANNDQSQALEFLMGKT